MRANLLISCAATALLIGIGSANAQGAAEHKGGPKEGPAAAATQPRSAMPAEQGMAEHRSAAESPKADAASSARPSLNEPKAHQGAANEKASPNTHGAAANEKNAEKNAPKAAQTSPADKAAPKSTAAEQSKQKPDHAAAQRDKSASEPKTGRSAATGKNEPGKGEAAKIEPSKTGASATSNPTESGRSATSTTTGAGAGTNATTHTGVNAQEHGTSAASLQIDPQKQERIRTALSSSKVENIRHVDFNVSVGTRIPERYHFYPLPTEIVDIVPEYRGFEYMVVDNEIVIVNPRTREIVYSMSEGRSAGMNHPSVDCR
jgi:hypothetical protein